MEDYPKYLSLNAVSKLSGLTAEELVRFDQAGRLPLRRYCHQISFLEEEVLEWLRKGATINRPME